MKVTVILILLIWTGNALATGAGTTAFSFLRVEQGARAAAMGGAFTAVADDLNALWWNPAGLTGISKQSLLTSYRNYLLDCQSGVAAYGRPFRKGVGALSVSYDHYGTNDRLDENGIQDGTFGVSSLAAAAGFGMAVPGIPAFRGKEQTLAAGAVLKLAYMGIDSHSSAAVAADLGIRYRWAVNKGLTVGMAVSNLGAQLTPFIDERESIPLTVRAGVSYPPQHLPLLLSLEAVKASETDLSLVAGGEFTLIEEKLFVRGGYSWTRNKDWKIDSEKDGMAGISLGAGFRAGAYAVDYAFTPAGQLGTINRFSFSGTL